MVKPKVRGKTTIKGTTYEYALYNYKRPPGKPWHLIFIALADCKTLASHLASLSEFAALGLHAALWSALIIESEGSQRLPLRGLLQFFWNAVRQ
jgi:hypothetical protein